MDSRHIEFQSFREKEGKNCDMVLTNLSSKLPFIEALNTSLGQELLRDLLRMYERKLDKVINGNATERDKEALIVFKCLSSLWVGKINSYNNDLRLLKERGKERIIYTAFL